MPGTAHCKFDHLFFASYKALGAWPPLALSPQALAAMTASSTCQLNLIRQFSHSRCIKNVTFGCYPSSTPPWTAWVAEGCRARFEMTTSSFSGHLLRAEKDSPYTGRRNYTVWPPAHDDINGSLLGPREIALTFDDAGSHTAQKMIKKRGQNSSTLMLLDALDAAQISAGFFVNSDVDGQLLLSMAMRGHLVGSHADNHDRHFPDVPSANFSRVLRRVERVFMDWLHQKPVLIRAPFGEIDVRVLEVLHDRHYLHVG